MPEVRNAIPGLRQPKPPEVTPRSSTVVSSKGGSAATALPTDGSSGGEPEQQGQGAETAAGGGGTAGAMDGVGCEEYCKRVSEEWQGQQVAITALGVEGKGPAGGADGNADEVDDGLRPESHAGAPDKEKVGAGGSAEGRWFGAAHSLEGLQTK